MIMVLKTFEIKQMLKQVLNLYIAKDYFVCVLPCSKDAIYTKPSVEWALEYYEL